MEHCLPIKPKFHPFQQPPKRMPKEVELKVKEEIEKLLKAKFIRPTRSVQWLANIVHVMKKNGKLRACVDLRDLNAATPKDMYVIRAGNMGLALWVSVGWFEILEGWAQKMKARKKSGLFGPIQIGPRANWVWAGLGHMCSTPSWVRPDWLVRTRVRDALILT